MDQEVLKQIMSELGKRGGKKTKERYGSEFYIAIGKIGAKKRWKEQDEKESKQLEVSDASDGDAGFDSST